MTDENSAAGQTGTTGTRDTSSAGDTPPVAAGYNTLALERLTGVPAATFRAWERRYGVPSPQRLPGGQRVYSEQDVATVRWLREQTERGLTVSRAIAQLQHPPPPAAESTGPAYQPPALAQALVESALRYDTAGVERALSQALAAHPLEEVCLAVVTPALVEVGERWHRGEITPAVEHFATNLVRRRLEQLASVLGPGEGPPQVVVGAAPGELHDVGALMFGVFLRRRGIRTLFLGAAVPVDAAVDVARRLQPRVLSLAAATAAAAAEVRAVSLALDGLAPPRPRFAFGGRAFDEDPALIEGIQGVYLGPDLRAAAETVEALLLEPRERSLR